MTAMTPDEFESELEGCTHAEIAVTIRGAIAKATPIRIIAPVPSDGPWYVEEFDGSRLSFPDAMSAFDHARTCGGALAVDGPPAAIRMIEAWRAAIGNDDDDDDD